MLVFVFLTVVVFFAVFILGAVFVIFFTTGNTFLETLTIGAVLVIISLALVTGAFVFLQDVVTFFDFLTDSFLVKIFSSSSVLSLSFL